MFLSLAELPILRNVRSHNASVSEVYWAGGHFLALALCAPTLPARGQVVLTLANPVTDSFPLVDIDVNVTQNGGPAALISGTNFTVREDGIPGNVIGLTGCGGTSSAAIALVVDTSTSMNVSLGSGPAKNRSYAKFNDAISKFIASMPGPSLVALVPFADTSTLWYPDSINSFIHPTTLRILLR